MGFRHASFFITSIWFSSQNYNQVNQALLLWRYFDNSFGTSSSFGEFIYHFSFTQTQVYTLSLRGDVKNIILCKVIFHVIFHFPFPFFYVFFFIHAFVFQPQCLDTLSLRGDVSVYVGLVPHW
jgi:hypothetical protein